MFKGSGKVYNRKSRVIRFTLVFSVLTLVIACSSDTRQLFFDIPPPDPNEAARSTAQADAKSESNQTSLGLAAFFPSLNEDMPRPPIEDLEEWDKVEAILPKDEEEDVDWSAALRQGIIRPRHGGDPRDLLATIFQWDFIIPAPAEEEDEEDEEESSEADDEEDEPAPGEGHEDDSIFAHSSHTQWLSCDNCHMSVYSLRRKPYTMKQMKKGASCGTCHGKVAFSLKTCGRCHPNG